VCERERERDRKVHRANNVEAAVSAKSRCSSVFSLAMYLRSVASHQLERLWMDAGMQHSTFQSQTAETHSMFQTIETKEPARKERAGAKELLRCKEVVRCVGRVGLIPTLVRQKPSQTKF